LSAADLPLDRAAGARLVYGLMCAPDGCPVAIEVFEGDTGDPATVRPSGAGISLSNHRIITGLQQLAGRKMQPCRAADP
jgi:hypothetical protein